MSLISVECLPCTGGRAGPCSGAQVSKTQHLTRAGCDLDLRGARRKGSGTASTEKDVNSGRSVYVESAWKEDFEKWHLSWKWKAALAFRCGT